MDNLTHSLAGAVLGQLGLKKKTGLGMATLIIAANIPDIDAFATLLGGVQHLAIRRGITHGPIAMVILPLLLTGFMLWFDRWQTKRGKRPTDRLPIHKGWLLALAYIGCLSHPALDWLNSYGVRLLEPFSSQWYYGDSIFIIDIWIWAALIIGVWISRRREKKGRDDWQRPAWVSFTVICAYIFANGLITGKAEADTALAVEQRTGQQPAQVVANPMPVTFWRRDMIWQMVDENGTAYGETIFDLFDPELFYWKGELIVNDASEQMIADAKKADPDALAFLFWARMPVLQQSDDPDNAGRLVLDLADMRFRDPLVKDRFTVRTTMPPKIDPTKAVRGTGSK
ncbi:metal-dependent hydrolase [Parasphingorhabdus litoris]|uniref:Metal-dependent hydrolase n=1 Tax=Parasphingorhabdus litoris TaxID=394733 RepID=A0ABN1AMQ7_9SPHN|nr:metal-dependent hydrolase [Parasphingorhabdus litoris]